MKTCRSRKISTSYADLRDLDRDERQDTFARLLDFTDLHRFTSRLAGNLSGGMKQKLGLACALINTPKLLLLDEPGVGVDPVSRRELWKMVKDLTTEGIGIVLVRPPISTRQKPVIMSICSIRDRKLFGGKPDVLTGSVKDRVFRLDHFDGNKREVLASALNREGVRDGTIQGDAIRLLFAENIIPDVSGISGAENGRLTPVATSFRRCVHRHIGRWPGRTKRAGRGLSAN